MLSRVMNLYRKGKRVPAPPARFGKAIPPREPGSRWPHCLDGVRRGGTDVTAQ